MAEEIGDVVIHVKVPKKYAETFRKDVKAMAWYLSHKDELFEDMRKLKGIMKTNKTWKEPKREIYEGFTY